MASGNTLLDVDSDEDESNLSLMFDGAATFLQTIVTSLDNNNLLYLYGLYKQSTVGPCNIAKPAFYDIKGKQKWESWKTLGEMSKEESMIKYIEKIKEIAPELNFHPEDSNKNTDNQIKQNYSLGGRSVSTLANPDENINDDVKTVFDWVKEGHLTNVRQSLGCNFDKANMKDENGMALLHWACDRGHTDIVQLLLSHDAEIDIKDNDGQTPLHYGKFHFLLSLIHIFLYSIAIFAVLYPVLNLDL
ncbi:Acyl-CoA-binding domain-containing protein 6 [Nymphon striatum]|nr:Acyl-CoA-binding domain-containing protein 6 [Nymphon striatum]